VFSLRPVRCVLYHRVRRWRALPFPPPPPAHGRRAPTAAAAPGPSSLAFGIQQIIEGFVWLGIERDDQETREAGVSGVPVLRDPLRGLFGFPLSLFFTDTPRPTTNNPGGLDAAQLDLVWFYYPLALDTGELAHHGDGPHSIQYFAKAELPALQVLSARCLEGALSPADLCAVAHRPLQPERDALGNIAGGLAVAALFGVSSASTDMRFMSVVVLFAAILSLLLCYFFYRFAAAN